MDQLPATYTKIAEASQGDGGLLGLVLALATTCVGVLAFVSLAARSQGNSLSRWSPCYLLVVLAGLVALVIEDRVLVVPEGGMAWSAWCMIALLVLAPAMALTGLLANDRPRAWVPAGWCLLLSSGLLAWSASPPSDSGPSLRATLASMVRPGESPPAQRVASTSRPSNPRLVEAASELTQPGGSDAAPVRPHVVTTRTTSVPAPPADAEYTFPHLNFAYTAPNRSWRKVSRLPGGDQIPGMVLAMQGEEPTTYVGIGAHAMPVQFNESDFLSEIAGQFFANSMNFSASPVVTRTIGGINGASVDVVEYAWNGETFIRFWVGNHAGLTYFIAVRHRNDSRSSEESDFEQIAAGFRLIEPSAAYASRARQEDGYECRLVLEGEGWLRATGAGELPWVDRMAVRVRSEDGVIVLSLPVPNADLEAVSEVVRPLMEILETDSHRLSASTEEVKFADRVIDYEGYRNGSHFRLRLVSGPYSTHAILASTKRHDASGLDELLQCFQLTGDPPAADPPDSPKQRTALAEVVNQVGVREHAKGEKRAALQNFAVAVKYEPQNDVYADNYLSTYQEIEGPQATLQMLAENPPPGISETVVALQRGVALSELGRHAEAIDAFALAAAAGPLSDEWLSAMSNAAVLAQRFDEVLGAMDDAIKQRGGPKLERWRAVLLGRAGRHEESISALLRQAQAAPGDGAVTYALAEAYEDAERFDEGVQVCQAALERFPDESDFHILLCRLKLEKGDHETARAALQECLAIDPANAEAKEMLTHVSAMMGRGNNQQIRQPIEPAPLSPLVAESLRRAAQLETPESAGAAGVYDVHRVATYAYEQGKPLRITERLRCRVLNRAGVESMALLSTTFNPLCERVFINELVVRDEQDVEIARGSLEDYYVMDDSAAGLDSYNQLLKAPVPGVRPGCTIDFTMTTEKLSQNAKFGFHSRFLCSSRECGVNAVCLQGDIDRVAFESRGVSPVKPDDRTVVWIAGNTPAAVKEPFQPDPEEYLPVVQLSDAGASWQSLSHEYLTDLAALLERDPEVQRLAAELVNSHEPLARRIEILARYVQDAITYQGLEFGVRGVIPHSVAQICRTRTGDCKDHALLLHHLLREAGVASWLALINTSGPVQPKLPSLDQFDHMVLVVPNMPCRDGVVAQIGLIDPTQKTIDPLRGVPSSFAGNRILVLAENRTGLDELPAASALDGLVTCKRVATIVPDSPESPTASLRVTETVEFGSELSSLLRMALQNETPQGRREALQQMIAGRRAVDVSEASAQNLDDPTRPLVIHCQYVVADAFQEVAAPGKPYTGALPAHWARLYCSPEKLANRKTPFQFSTPVTFRSETKLIAPPGYRVASESATPLGATSGPFAWSWKCVGEPDGAAHFALEMKRSAGTFGAEQYDSYQRTAEDALRATGRAVTVTRSGPSANDGL